MRITPQVLASGTAAAAVMWLLDRWVKRRDARASEGGWWPFADPMTANVVRNPGNVIENPSMEPGWPSEEHAKPVYSGPPAPTRLTLTRTAPRPADVPVPPKVYGHVAAAQAEERGDLRPGDYRFDEDRRMSIWRGDGKGWHALLDRNPPPIAPERKAVTLPRWAAVAGLVAMSGWVGFAGALLIRALLP